MPLMTYGHHAECAAAALNRLVLEDRAPVGEDAVAVTLRCREAAMAALRQRLHAFGLAPTRQQGTTQPLRKPISVTNLDRWLTTLLSRIAFEAPVQSLDGQPPPSEILGRPNSEHTAELWRRAAVELLAGSHVLDVADEKPWLRDPGAGWHLIRDTAVIAEALVVLSARFEEIGLLPRDPAQTLGSAGEQRLVASQCARIATWYATTDAADYATPRTVGERTMLGPVVVVTSPNDLTAAQRRLARFLSPVNAGDSTYSGEPEISADGARQIVASQLFLCRVFGQTPIDPPGPDVHRKEFTIRRDILREIQPQLRFIVDVTPQEPHRPRVWQQGEITSSVRRMQRVDEPFRLTNTQQHDLASATHEVHVNLARCLRRELLRSNSNLRMSDPSVALGARKILRGSHLHASLTDLINQPEPAHPSTWQPDGSKRAELRHTLDVTPSNERELRPYPSLTVRGPSL